MNDRGNVDEMASPTPRPDDDCLAWTAAYARRDPLKAEQAIAAHVANAIQDWCLEEATFWQRVKFKARLLRTARRSNTADIDGGRYAC